jgi:hypothetical protein
MLIKKQNLILFAALMYSSLSISPKENLDFNFLLNLSSLTNSYTPNKLHTNVNTNNRAFARDSRIPNPASDVIRNLTHILIIKVTANRNIPKKLIIGIYV